MTLEAHLAELDQRHRALEEKIEVEMARPMADSLKISQMKKEKLRIKDEIARLKAVSKGAA